MKPDDTKNIKVMWWNVNRRLDVISRNLSPIKTYKAEVLFVMETAMGYDVIPDIEG